VNPSQLVLSTVESHVGEEDGKPVISVGDVEGRNTVVGGTLIVGELVGDALGTSLGDALGDTTGETEGVSEGALLVHMQQSAGHVT